MTENSKILCPNCQKEIKKKAEVEIPSSTVPVDYESISILVPPSNQSGVTHGSLFFKDGKYFLVFESIVRCPYCKEIFCLDICLPALIFT
jgi:hypothetical protein